MKLRKKLTKCRYKGNISMEKTINYNLYANTYVTRREPGDHRYYLQTDNDDTLMDYLLECLIQRKKYKLMIGKKKLELSDIQKELRFRLKLVKKTLRDGSMLLLTYSYSKKYWIPFQSLLYNILAEIDDTDELDFTMGDYGFCVKQILTGLSKLRASKLNLEEFKEAPSYYILFNNGIFDNKHKKIIKYQDAKQYHFTKGIDWDLINIEQANKLYIRIAEQIIKDWSDDDEDKENLLWQIVTAAMEGDGRGKAIIFKSDGGGGKSSFLNILRAILGAPKVLDCGIYELNNDNKLANLNADTHVIVGDDADTNKKMPALSLSRLKSLSDGGSFLIDVKYEASKPISTRALLIQNTNTDIAIYENNQALLSRFVKVEWTNRDFRSELASGDIDFDLKDLIGKAEDPNTINKEFIEAFIAVAMSKKYFEKFIIPKSVQEDTVEMLDSNDQIKDYFNFMQDQGLLNLPYINISTEHKRYEMRLKDINPSASPLKIRNFTKELGKLLENNGYNLLQDRKSPNAFSKLEYNNEVNNYVTDYAVNEKPKILANYYFNSKNKLNPNNLNVDNLSPENAKDVLIYQYLVNEVKDLAIIEKYTLIFED